MGPLKSESFFFLLLALFPISVFNLVLSFMSNGKLNKKIVVHKGIPFTESCRRHRLKLGRSKCLTQGVQILSMVAILTVLGLQNWEV